ncbi:MAG: hypothetical protein GY712_10300 [Oceanicoccus sp.]|uniref:hypothetical protein n=2 Tax=Oceanicoccus sp. TaxID=2691044 RepID=UPI002612B073|nr:hypothetical protein [Oceanicoccus sp.]MCP3908391.1 hypothetical protein [Oceanicoccus sp.]
MSVQKKSAGFSSVELVVVILLLGIISTFILPRFTSRDGFAEYAIRDQFISAYRFAQQRAMYDHGGSCYSVNIDSNGFRPFQDGATFGSFEEVEFSGDYEGLSISSAVEIYFDGLGNAYTIDCGNTPVPNPLILTVNPGAVAIQIYPTGFIQ